MNSEQFDAWLKTYTDAFPSVLAWLNGLGDPAATTRVWRRVLEAVDYADAMQATERMICGELAAPLGWERFDLTAIQLRSYAGRIADDRRRRITLNSYRETSRYGVPQRSIVEEDKTLSYWFRRCQVHTDRWKRNEIDREELEQLHRQEEDAMAFALQQASSE